MAIINYLSAGYGTGKTHGLMAEAKKKALDGEYVVIAMRSKRGIAETQQAYFSKKVVYYDVKVIVSDDDPSNKVLARVVKELKAPKAARNKGRILFITHKALFMLPYAELLSGKILLIDEIPPPVEAWEISGEPITRLLETVESYGDMTDGYVCLKPKGGYKSQLKKSAKAEPGAAGGRQAERDIANSVASMWSDTLVKQSDLDKHQSGDAAHTIPIFSRLKFHLFSECKSVLVSGAHFEDSLFCLYGTMQNVQFIERLDLKKKLQAPSVQTGKYTTICYGHCGTWSSRLRDEKISDGVSVLQHVASRVSEFFGDRQFLYSANKGIDGESLFPQSNAVRLPNVSHGLNSFSHIDNAVFLAATNPMPFVSTFHLAHGISYERVNKAIYFENVGQSIYRCSIRDPDSVSAKTIIVIDKAVAEWLHAELPGSKLEEMSWIPVEIGMPKQPGRKPVHFNGADKTFFSRLQKADRTKKSELIESMDLAESCQVSAKASTIAKAIITDKCNEIAIESYKDIVTKFFGLQFNAKVATVPSRILLQEDNNEFIECLQKIHSQDWKEKDQLPLICHAFFDPDKAEDTYRGNDNVEFARGISLDNDGGVFSFNQFVQLFPNIRIVIWNTASSSATLPKWRAYIPTTGILSRQAYEFIVEHMFSIIAAAGFHSKTSKNEPFDGFDTSKKGPASLFRFPCQAIDPDDSFFIDFNDKDRRQLDVREWIHRYFIEKDDVEQPSNDGVDEVDRQRDELAIESACQYWRSQTIEGTGNNEFLNLGLKLASAQASVKEIREILFQESQFARSDASKTKRRRQIPSIIKSLRGWGHVPR